MNENSDYKTKEIPKPSENDREEDRESLILFEMSNEIFKTEKVDHRTEDLKHRNKDLEMQLKQRKISFKWVLGLITVYLVFVGVFLVLIFCEFTKTHHTFSPTIVMTLLGTTTATVLGLPYIVLKNLFPHSNEK